jgi:nicotinamide-nucleotide amidase
MRKDRKPEEEIGVLLRREKATLSVAESCTGGLIAHRITNVSGSSDYFRMGIVSYSNWSKGELLSVPEGEIDRYGPVSHEVARKMAQGIRLKAKTDIGLATTGMPVGTVFIGLDHREGTEVREFRFDGTREEIKEKASQKALEMLTDHLMEMNNKACKKIKS